MSPVCDVPRRRFLRALLLGLLAGRALAGCDSSSRSQSDSGQPPQWLVNITGERDAVLRIGNDYLEAYPGERSLEVVMSGIEQALAAQLEGRAIDAADVPQVVAALQRAVRRDYRRGDAVSVQGWVLSRTEARLYAAVALLAV